MSDIENDNLVDLEEVPSKKQKITHVNSISDVTVPKAATSDSDETVTIKKADKTECIDSNYPRKNAKQFLTKLDVSKEAANGESSSSPGQASQTSTESEASESDWQPPTHGALDWIYSQMLDNQDPRELLLKLVPNVSSVSTDLTNYDVWRLLIRVLTEPPRRTKLPHVNTLDDVINLIKTSRKIMILTGAGVSVSCGIPDFRSRNGVYARLAVDFPDLPNPEAMFDITYFKQDPRPFFKFAKEIYPGQFNPSPVHRFISLLEQEGKLLRNYTQNIDTLEQVAGISKVIQCHGSFATASCQVCRHQVDGSAIRDDVFNQVVPLCPRCPFDGERGILKPDIVFFGESLPQHFHRQLTSDKDEVDLLMVIGSALKVRPVALIPNSLPEGIPQILINREPLRHINFDVELLGDADGVIAEISRRLGDVYAPIFLDTQALNEITELPETEKLEDCSAAAESLQAGGSDPAVVVEPPPDHVSMQTDEGEASAEVEELKEMWKSRWKPLVSKKLPGGAYFYDGKHRYIFPGAEVPPEEESDSSSDEESEGESTSDGDINPASRGSPSFLHAPNLDKAPEMCSSPDVKADTPGTNADDFNKSGSDNAM